MQNIKEKLQGLYDSDDGGYSLQESRNKLHSLEAKKKALLEEKEDMWRLKSCPLWLASGDENIKLFQAYTKGRKIKNIIWSLENQEKH